MTVSKHWPAVMRTVRTLLPNAPQAHLAEVTATIIARRAYGIGERGDALLSASVEDIDPRLVALPDAPAANASDAVKAEAANITARIATACAKLARAERLQADVDALAEHAEHADTDRSPSAEAFRAARFAATMARVEIEAASK